MGNFNQFGVSIFSSTEVKQDVLLNVAALIQARGAEIALPTRTLHIEPASAHPADPQGA